MKFLLYDGRHGEQLLTAHTPEAWEYLKAQMQEDNRMDFDTVVKQFGHEAMFGSFEYTDSCYLSIDDGGEIHTIELTEVPQ